MRNYVAYNSFYVVFFTFITDIKDRQSESRSPVALEYTLLKCEAKALATYAPSLLQSIITSLVAFVPNFLAHVFRNSLRHVFI